MAERITTRLNEKLSELGSNIPEAELDRMIPIVETLASKPDGTRRLAEICAALLHDPSEARPEPEQPEMAEPKGAASSRPGGRNRRRSGKGGGGSKGDGRGRRRPSSGRSRSRN